jgi:purine-binding chemotaxis protein CheW
MGDIASHSAQTAVSEPIAATDPRAGKYLVFCLGNEEFAVSVQKVREIIGIADITAVPYSPAYVKGVINLRGKVVPVVDLRLRLQMLATPHTERTCVMVLQITGSAGRLTLGALVDSVSEVLRVSPSDIEEALQFGDTLPNPYVLGLANIKGRVKILLEIDCLMREVDSTVVPPSFLPSNPDA